MMTLLGGGDCSCVEGRGSPNRAPTLGYRLLPICEET